MRVITRYYTREEEAELIRKAQAGDLDARKKVITSHLPFVMSRARERCQFLGDRSTYDDLIQEGTIGLYRALDKFDLSRGLPFMAYAGHWVDYHMRTFSKHPRERLTIETTIPRIRPGLSAEHIDDPRSGRDAISDDPIPEELFSMAEMSAGLRQALGRLKKRFGPLGWDIVQSRFLDDEDGLREIADRHGVSRETVRLKEVQIRTILARYLENYAPEAA